MARTPRDNSAAPGLDHHIASRIRARRHAVGLRLKEAGALLGLSQQQMSRLELGHNRILASQLYVLSRAYGVPVGYFFEGYKDSEGQLQQVNNLVSVHGVQWDEEHSQSEQDELLAALKATPKEIRDAVGQLLLVLQKDSKKKR